MPGWAGIRTDTTEHKASRGEGPRGLSLRGERPPASRLHRRQPGPGQTQALGTETPSPLPVLPLAWPQNGLMIHGGEAPAAWPAHLWGCLLRRLSSFP